MAGGLDCIVAVYWICRLVIGDLDCIRAVCWICRLMTGHLDYISALLVSKLKVGVHLVHMVFFLESCRAIKGDSFLACSVVIGKAGKLKLQDGFHVCVLLVHAV